MAYSFAASANLKNFFGLGLSGGADKYSLVYPSGDSAAITTSTSNTLHFEYMYKRKANQRYFVHSNYQYSQIEAPTNGTLIHQTLETGNLKASVQLGKRFGVILGVNYDYEHYINIQNNNINGIPFSTTYWHGEVFFTGSYKRVRNILTLSGGYFDGNAVVGDLPINSAFYWSMRNDLKFILYKNEFQFFIEFKQKHFSFESAEQNRSLFHFGFKYYFY